MMKKLVCLLCVLMLCSCSGTKDTPQYTYDIVSDKVDMSAYPGVSSTNHNFRLVGISQMFNVIDNKSSAIFYLGRSNCNCCQKVCRYINEVAQELDVTVYYIDAYNEAEPLTQEIMDRMKEYLSDILSENEDGEKVLLTPHVFTVINGKPRMGQICYDDLDFDYEPTQAQIDTLKDVYRNIMKPFSTNKS